MHKVRKLHKHETAKPRQLENPETENAEIVETCKRKTKKKYILQILQIQKTSTP